MEFVYMLKHPVNGVTHEHNSAAIFSRKIDILVPLFRNVRYIFLSEILTKKVFFWVKNKC